MKEQNDITMAAGPWGPFPELCGSTPRQVKWKAAGIMNIIVAIVFPFAAIGIGNGLYEKVAREQRLRQEGRETDAVATRVWRYVGRYAHHVVAYEFAAGGEVRRGEAELPRPMWLGLSKGSHLTVSAFCTGDQPRGGGAGGGFADLAAVRGGSSSGWDRCSGVLRLGAREASAVARTACHRCRHPEHRAPWRPVSTRR